LEDLSHIRIGVTGMDHQREPGLPRRRDVIAKAPRLRVPRTVVIKIVEPGLADRDHLRLARKRHKLLDRDIKLLMGIMRMRSDRAEHVREPLGDRRHRGMPLHPGGNRNDARNARRLRTSDDGVELIGKIGKVEMAMTVYEHWSV